MLWILFDDFPFWIYSPTGHMVNDLGGWRVHPGYLTLSILLSENSKIFVKPWNTIPYSTVISWDTCKFLTLLKYMWLLSLFCFSALLIEKECKSWLRRCTLQREREREREIDRDRDRDVLFPFIYEDLWHFSPKNRCGKLQKFQDPGCRKSIWAQKKGALVVV